LKTNVNPKFTVNTDNAAQEKPDNKETCVQNGHAKSAHSRGWTFPSLNKNVFFK
jgi:hypothetical protein